MSVLVQSKTYSAPPVSYNKILHYAQCKNTDEQTKALIDECLAIVSGELTYKVCFAKLPVKIVGI